MIDQYTFGDDDGLPLATCLDWIEHDPACLRAYYDQRHSLKGYFISLFLNPRALMDLLHAGKRIIDVTHNDLLAPLERWQEHTMYLGSVVSVRPGTAGAGMLLSEMARVIRGYCTLGTLSALIVQPATAEGTRFLTRRLGLKQEFLISTCYGRTYYRFPISSDVLLAFETSKATALAAHPFREGFIRSQTVDRTSATFTKRLALQHDLGPELYFSATGSATHYQAASTYDADAHTSWNDIFLHILSDQSPTLLRVVSLGCGNGEFEISVIASYARDNPALQFVGIDLSYELLNHTLRTVYISRLPFLLIQGSFLEVETFAPLVASRDDKKPTVWMMSGGAVANVSTSELVSVLGQITALNDYLALDCRIYNRENEERLKERFASILSEEISSFYESLTQNGFSLIPSYAIRHTLADAADTLKTTLYMKGVFGAQLSDANTAIDFQVFSIRAFDPKKLENLMASQGFVLKFEGRSHDANVETGVMLYQKVGGVNDSK